MLGNAKKGLHLGCYRDDGEPSIGVEKDWAN
jgi:hypothetical protein